MITVRKSDARGHADHGWLDSRHTFSFADYYDPREMGFGSLRVINEDRVQPGMGFGTHPHRDMEIISYVLEGALEHKDSLGNGSVMRPGDVQRMSAGTGVLHSEENPSIEERSRFLQVWIVPERRGQLRRVGSRTGLDGAVTIHQDVEIFAAVLEPGEEVAHPMAVGRGAWI